MGGCTRECCSTASVIKWFKAIKNKKHHSFICFNIEEFYLSISQYLLNRALDFASAYNNITDNKRNIITHAKQLILVHKQQPWQNMGDTTFDVTMGSYDGAETWKFPPFPTAEPQHQHWTLQRQWTGHFKHHTKRHRKHQKRNMLHL